MFLSEHPLARRMIKRCAALLFAAVTGLCSAGCKASENESLTTLRLNEVAHSVFYAPLYAAIELGYFEEEGIDLSLTTGFGADKTMAALLSGDADIGLMGSESTVYAYVQGINDPVISFAQLTRRAGNFLVAREPIEDFKWQDLKGTTVLGGRKGGMPEMVFEYILVKNNIDPATDLTIDKSIDFGSTAAAFAGGLGDFTVEFEPHATGLEENGNGYVVASLGEESGYVPYTVFCARKSVTDESPDLIAGFTRAVQKGLIYVAEHTSEETAKVISPQFPESELPTLTTIIDRYARQDTWKDNCIFDEDSFDLLCNILRMSGELTTEVPYEELVNTSIAESAAQSIPVTE